jgi:hypothetical protein
MPAKTKFTAISEPTLNLTSGAPDALRWVGAQEAFARSRVESAQAALELALRNQRERPPETDGEDYDKRVRECQIARDDAWDAWKKAADMLHKFDKSVPDAKRDATEKITREEGERMLTLLAIHMREGTEQLITTVCQEVLSAQNERDVYRIVCTKLRDAMRGAVDSALREGHLPAWCKAAMEEVYPMAYPAEK